MESWGQDMGRLLIRSWDTICLDKEILRDTPSISGTGLFQSDSPWMICRGQGALIWKTVPCISPHSLGDKQEVPFPEFPRRCLWIVSFPRALTEGCFLSLRGYSYFWLFILSQRKLFSKHRPKDKNLLNVSLHFGTSEFKNLKYVPFN